MFGRKKEAGDGKKKKGCLRRLFSMAFGAVVVILALAFLLDDDTDYISEEEQSAADSEDDAILDDLIDLFFDWYGFIPEDDDSYNFQDNSAYADYDYDNYYDYYDDDYGNNDDFDRDQNTKQKTEKKNNTPASERREKFVKCAENYLGTPYKLGGNSRSGIDCSGLVYQAAIDAGLGTLPRKAKDMYSIANSISKDKAVKGDLVFFKDGSSVSHVAIYLGDNMLLHAISDGSKTGVVTSKLTNKYWKEHYYGMGRIISD